MASSNHTLSSPDISDVIHLLNTMKKQNEDILAQNKEILNDNRKLRQELLELKSYYDYPKHNVNVKASSRKRDEPEDEDESVHQHGPLNNKRARVTNLPEHEPERILELPASFDSLDDDCLGNVLDFVGKKCYSVFGRVNKRCHEMFCSKGLSKETYLYGYASLRLILQRDWYRHGIKNAVFYYNRRDILEWMLTDDNKVGYSRLKWLCREAILESRLDILREVFHRANNEGQLEFLRDCDNDFDLCAKAALFGKLECLKLLRENKCEWDKFTWGEAILYGHDHILEYLRNNGYPTEWQVESDSVKKLGLI